MPSSKQLALSLLLIPGLIGACARERASGPFDAWIDGANEIDVRELVDRGELPGLQYQASPPLITAGEAPELPPDVSVDELVALALDRNPTIVAARERVARLAERIPQEESLPDPMFETAFIGEMAETATGQVGAMATISQRFPLGGKLDVAARVAANEVAIASRELERTRLEVAAETRRAYWSFYNATRAIEVNTESRELLQQFHETAEVMYQVGRVTQGDVLRASNELNGLEAELIEFRRERDAAIAMLNRLMDRPIEAAIPAPPAVDEVELIALDLERLLDRASAVNPDLSAAHDRIRGHRERLRLARLNRWPDLTVGLTYNAVEDEGVSMVANGDDQWWLGFGVNLPIQFRRLEAAENEAARGLLESIAELGAAQSRVAFEVQEAVLRVEAQQELVELFRTKIVPDAQRALDSSLASYRGAGDVDSLSVIDNWRQLLQFQLMSHRNVAQLKQDIASLEEAIGAPLPHAASDRDNEVSQ